MTSEATPESSVALGGLVGRIEVEQDVVDNSQYSQSENADY